METQCFPYIDLFVATRHSIITDRHCRAVCSTLIHSAPPCLALSLTNTLTTDRPLPAHSESKLWRLISLKTCACTWYEHTELCPWFREHETVTSTSTSSTLPMHSQLLACQVDLWDFEGSDGIDRQNKQMVTFNNSNSTVNSLSLASPPHTHTHTRDSPETCRAYNIFVKSFTEAWPLTCIVYCVLLNQPEAKHRDGMSQGAEQKCKSF